MDIVQAATLIIALVALGLSILNSYIQWQIYRSGQRRDKPAIQVDVNWATPTFDMPDGSIRLGETYVTVTATNPGLRPVGVNRMGLDTADGRTIPLTQGGARPCHPGRARSWGAAHDVGSPY
jgi:hypothetical protein